jgi:lipoyl synthase
MINIWLRNQPDMQDSDLTSPRLPRGQKSPPKPPWLRVRLAAGAEYERVRKMVRGLGLETICEQARCPNQGECWKCGTATVLILGHVCTRRCGFCAVQSGTPNPPDLDEPRRVALAVAAMGWKHVVITSVTRDDLADGGAAQFGDCVKAVRDLAGTCSIELLIPDLQGNTAALADIVTSRPVVLGHNLETVPRLYPEVRPQADFDRSLLLLRQVKELDPDMLTKSAIMVGLGETWEELLETMQRLRQAGCDILTIGQYLAPSRQHLPVVRYYTLEEFDAIRAAGDRAGFHWVEAAPLARSSYHAERQVRPHSWWCP